MFQNLAVFFDNARLFWVPGRLDPVDHMMIWLVIVWVVFFDLLLPSRRRAGQTPAGLRPRALVPGGVRPYRDRRPGRLGVAAHGRCASGDRARRSVKRRASSTSSSATSCCAACSCRASRKDTIDLVTALVGRQHDRRGSVHSAPGAALPIYVVDEYQTHVRGAADHEELLLHAAVAGAGTGILLRQAEVGRVLGRQCCRRRIWRHYGYRIRGA